MMVTDWRNDGNVYNDQGDIGLETYGCEDDDIGHCDWGNDGLERLYFGK